MNPEIKKVVSRMKEAQSQFQSLMKKQNWMDDAKRYAERQGKEVKKLFGPDVDKLKHFLEHERKELEKFQKQIPSEVKKIRKFFNEQKKDFEKILTNVRKMSAASPKSKTTKKMGTKKVKTTKTSAKKKSTSSSEARASS